MVCELSETILILEKSLGIWNIVDEVDALPNMEKGGLPLPLSYRPMSNSFMCHVDINQESVVLE